MNYWFFIFIFPTNLTLAPLILLWQFYYRLYKWFSFWSVVVFVKKSADKISVTNSKSRQESKFGITGSCFLIDPTDYIVTYIAEIKSHHQTIISRWNQNFLIVCWSINFVTICFLLCFFISLILKQLVSINWIIY